MVDGCMRSSDPNIYAVGEVASYEGGMVYGLWKPGMEQAEARRFLCPESLWGHGTSDLWQAGPIPITMGPMIFRDSKKGVGLGNSRFFFVFLDGFFVFQKQTKKGVAVGGRGASCFFCCFFEGG